MQLRCGASISWCIVFMFCGRAKGCWEYISLYIFSSNILFTRVVTVFTWWILLCAVLLYFKAGFSCSSRFSAMAWWCCHVVLKQYFCYSQFFSVHSIMKLLCGPTEGTCRDSFPCKTAFVVFSVRGWIYVLAVRSFWLQWNKLTQRDSHCAFYFHLLSTYIRREYFPLHGLYSVYFFYHSV